MVHWTPEGGGDNLCVYIKFFTCASHLPTPTADQVATRDEGISASSRVFFIDSARKMNQQLQESAAPSVNFRGLMDPVRYPIH